MPALDLLPNWLNLGHGIIERALQDALVHECRQGEAGAYVLIDDGTGYKRGVIRKLLAAVFGDG